MAIRLCSAPWLSNVAARRWAETSKAIQHLVAEGKIVGVKDGLFLYGATHAGTTNGAGDGMSS